MQKVNGALQQEVRGFFKKTKGINESETKVSAINYFEIHGTVPNDFVQANSHLCEDIHEEFVTRSQNIRSEVIVPGDFVGFTGFDGKATVTNNTQKPFVIEFGSQLD